MQSFETLSIGTIALVTSCLLAVEFLFSGSEMALLSADHLKLKAAAKEGSWRAKRALELANHPERVLATTLVVTSACMITISTLFSIYMNSIYEHGAEWRAILVASPLIVIFGELLPKSLFQRQADRLALWASYPVTMAYWALYPITWLVSRYTSRLSKLLGPLTEWLGVKPRSRREELRSLLTYGKKESEIKASEKRMIKRIFDFKDAEAKHALIPLVKVEAIAESASIEEALKRFQQHRHSRMPIYSERIDNIVGILDVADLFTVSDLSHPINDFISPAHYVPETQTLHNLLEDMHREETEMVVVVDEYGGAVGILTFEDIVEEIVGEIQDEYDVNTVPFKQLAHRSWLILAKTEIALINEELKLGVPEGDYETLGGFLLQQFGRIPLPGDELYLDTSAGSLKFTIKRANERRIDSITIEIIS